MLGPVNPEISGERLAKRHERQFVNHTHTDNIQTVSRKDSLPYLREEIVFFGDLIKHFVRLYGGPNIPL